LYGGDFVDTLTIEVGLSTLVFTDRRLTGGAEQFNVTLDVFFFWRGLIEADMSTGRHRN